MAWLCTTVSFGVIAGPALGGMLPRNDLHLDLRFGRFMVDSFSIPFCGGFLCLLILARLPGRWGS
jgi:hypothetical protein